MSKGYARNAQEALKINDIYLTSSQLLEIEQQDIDRRINEAISKIK